MSLMRRQGSTIESTSTQLQCRQVARLVEAAHGSGFRVMRRLVGPRLRSAVLQIIGYQEDAVGHFRQIKPAPTSVPVLLAFRDPFVVRMSGQAGGEAIRGGFVAGLCTGRVEIDSFGGSSCVQIDLAPIAAHRLLGVPMGLLRDRVVGLEDILGAAAPRLIEQLALAPTWEARLARIEAFLEAHLTPDAGTPSVAAQGFAELTRAGGTTRITALSKQLQVSRKHLAHEFEREIGLPPKTVARLIRFNRALGRARSDDASWASIAATCGYADQAHLIREFIQFAGESPEQWRSGATADAPRAR